MSSEAPDSIQFRCVCGQEVSADPNRGGQCTACGRSVTLEMLHGEMARTVCLPSDGSGSSSGSGEASVSVDDERYLGRVLGHFRIVGRLGSGGMGSVYRALDESLQRYVALKVIGGDGGSGRENQPVDQLLQEARAQARVNHANIVHIYYVSRDDESPFLAMELVNGPTLSERISEGPLGFDEIVAIALQTTAALQHSARFDIVHGDIKPSNILLADRRDVKLSDFGLSRRISHQGDAPKSITGTPSYMSPEACEGEPPSVRSDQYSLGIMLYQLTFERLPFSIQGDTVRDLLRAHRESTISFPVPWPKHVPEQWKPILEQMLQKDPADRYADYATLRRDLRQVRPLNLPKAGRLVRGLAWLFDLALVFVAQQMISVPLTVGPVASFVRDRPLLRLLTAAAAFAAPLGAAFVQSRWRTTPGKKLFQIRIVDNHGLRPTRGRLASRSVAQFLIVWLACMDLTLRAAGLQPSWGRTIFGVTAVVATIADSAFALFHPRGKSLHDMFFGTRVVLDAARRAP